jgi:hypothetical protein
MLNSLLENIGHRLGKKPFTWMSWWRGKRWIAVFLIIPPLSEACPLWKRDEAGLRSLRLFGLEPQVLHAELQHYWRKPFWQRWWLSLFTAIHRKRKAYAYYQRCLAFGKAQKQHPYMVSAFKGSGRERAILLELVAWLDRDIRQCEKILEKHAGDLNWLPSRFTPILSRYEQKTEQRLLKYMDKKLKKLPMVRSRIKKEYPELGEFMRDYLLSGLFPPEQGSADNDGATASSGAYEATEDSLVSDNQELVYLGPTVAARNTLGMYPFGAACLDDMDSVGDWVSVQREAVASLLGKGRPEAYIEIKVLLEHSLNSIRMLIAPKMECYQQLIQKAKQGKVEFEVAIEHSEDLQPRLMRFFRSSALLFHPDKSDKNAELRCLKTELFKEFNQFAENSRETLREGLETLKKCIPKLESKYQGVLEQIQRNREKSRADLEEAMKRDIESKARLARMEEKIERLDNLLIENGMMSPSPMPEEERPGSSTDFFTRRACK